MRSILKNPAEYAKQLHDSFLCPSIVRITIELARLRPQLHPEYIEEVMREVRKYGMEKYGHIND